MRMNDQASQTKTISCRGITNPIEELPTTAVLQKDELMVGLDTTAVALHNIGMLQKLVHTNLLLGRFDRPWVLLHVDLFHGTGFAGVPVDQQLDLGKGTFAKDLQEVPAFDELAHHFSLQQQRGHSCYCIWKQEKRPLNALPDLKAA